MRILLHYSCVALLVSGALACGGVGPRQPREASLTTAPVYPDTWVDGAIELLHGREVYDPYRWLELDDDPGLRRWQEAQTKVARAYLDAIPGREGVRERIAEVYRVDDEGAPRHFGEYYFQTRRLAEQDQPVLYVSSGFPAEQRVLIDPAALGDGDSTVALDWWFPSWDGELVAYGLSSTGSERSVLHVIETATGERLADQIPNTRSCRVAWLRGRAGFFYTRRPDPESEEKYFNKVYAVEDRAPRDFPWVNEQSCDSLRA